MSLKWDEFKFIKKNLVYSHHSICGTVEVRRSGDFYSNGALDAGRGCDKDFDIKIEWGKKSNCTQGS